MKLYLEENLRDYLGHFGLVKGSLATTLNTWSMKDKKGKSDFVKLKTSALHKTLWKRCHNWGENFANHISD